MPEPVYTLAHLTPEQERLLNEAEGTLGGPVLLAYSKDQVEASQLTPNQLACVEGLEKKLGLVILAVQPT